MNIQERYPFDGSIFMNNTFFQYYAFWPDALPQDLSRNKITNFCSSKDREYSFGKNKRDLDSKVNMTMEQMCFTSDSIEK